MSKTVLRYIGRLPLLIFLLLLPFCAYAAAENTDDASVAQQIDNAAGSTEDTAATTDGAKKVEDKLMTMKTPTNVLELIENLQEVHRSRIAFEEAFYTEENIMKITAGKGANIYVTHNKGEKRLRISPTDLRSIAGDLEATAWDRLMPKNPYVRSGEESLKNDFNVHNCWVTLQETFSTRENIRKIAACKDTNIRVTNSQGKSVLELVESLHEAYRCRLAFEEAFYTEENIGKIAACADVTLSQEKANETTDCIQAGIELTTNPDGKNSVTISVIFCRLYTSTHYLAIEKLFGNAWQRSKFEPLGSNQVYRAPTDIHGNKKMEYTRHDGNIVERGIFAFAPDGLLNYFYLHSEEQ